MLSQIVKFTIVLLAVACVKVETVGQHELIDLNEDNWRLMLNGQWMVEFYAPWCPACRNLASTWQLLALNSGEDYKVAKIDVTTSPALSGRFFVTALPTIYHVMDGQFRQYRGSRDLESLEKFVQEKRWMKVEPISAWKKPDSVQMSVLSYFFTISHYLKELNTQLHQEYGLPPWGAYIVFAIVTIVFGAGLGLILVCLVDFIYPPKNIHRQSFSETKKKIKQDDEQVEEIAGDELEDEDEEVSTDDGEKYSDSDSDEAGDFNRKSQSKKGKKDKSSPVNDDAVDKEEDDVDDKDADNDENIKETKTKKETEKTSSQEIKKRKPRKAD